MWMDLLQDLTSLWFWGANAHKNVYSTKAKLD